MNDLRQIVLPLLLLTMPALSAHATAAASSLPRQPVGACALHKFTPRQVVQLLFDNVVHASEIG